jgi:hypothetical protein
MNTDLIALLEKLTPTEGEWHVDRWDYIHINGKITFEPHSADSNDVTLASLAPTMRIEILDMAKEIERLNEQNIDLANRFNLQSQEIEELKSELELERFEEDDSHLYDEDNLTPQPK